MDRHVVCIVCDFFYPRLGGVELHIWSLSQCLMKEGHKVVVVTHAYGERRGVRFMSCGLKVYYLPLVPMVEQDAFPTLCAWLPLFRHILVREGITIVHGHQATSCMSNEALLFARTLGYHACYTDHSLFGFADAGSIHINKVLEFTLSDVDAAICVSNACRENLLQRASLPPEMVHTIPNAIDPTRFLPCDASSRAALNASGRVVVVVLSRLVHRKGTDLLTRVIPKVCAMHSTVDFLVGGDGPKKVLLQEMCEQHGLHDRVELLGSVPHDQVRDLLVRGHIFLNCSLTESFCIAIVEAACCGLFVVSTRVGGVVEVLPQSMTMLCEPDVDTLSRTIIAAIPTALAIDPAKQHERVRRMYDWRDVCTRTLDVYDAISRKPIPSIIKRLRRYQTAGPIAGVLFCFVAAALSLLVHILEYFDPKDSIDRAMDWTPQSSCSGDNSRRHTEHNVGAQIDSGRKKSATR